MTGADPLGAGGDAWLRAARVSLARVSVTFDVEMSISGVGGDVFDCVDVVFGLMPYMAVSMCLFVLLLVGLSFRSLLVPLRSILSIGVTVTWGYGSAILTYQHGWLSWTGVGGLAPAGAQMWLVPVILLPILVGISLDYGIFLLSRVAELRAKGASTEDVIRQGVVSTGSIISSAIAIMAIAFSGLLFSANPTLDMVAFYLVFSCLFDTLVLWPLLVPAAMLLLGDANSWPAPPRRPRPPRRCAPSASQSSPPARPRQQAYALRRSPRVAE